MDVPEAVIVCGVDGSDAGQRALEWAIDEAIRRNCTLRVVTAWWWDGVEVLGAASSPAAASLQAQETQDVAVDRALAASERAPEVERLVVRNTPSVAVTTAAVDAELLVLGSHGHGAAYDKLVGSTSQRAIHHASCPVVILPDPRQAEKKRKHAKAKRGGADVPHTTPMF